MRTYMPGSNILNQTWIPPAVTPVLYSTASGVCADYDGDGFADLPVYRDGYGSIYSLTNGIILNNAGSRGGPGWVPVH